MPGSLPASAPVTHADPTLTAIHRLFHPRAIALVGISRDPDSFGYPLLEITQRCGYPGTIHLVNPNADTILGLPCHASVRDLPGDIDMAMIMLPRRLANVAIAECVEKRVGSIVIITAGFAERDDDGRAHQEELVTGATRAGIPVVGPNTLGYFSAPARLDAIMAGFIRSGTTSLLTQSGNLTTSLTFPGSERGFGFDYVVDLGNQAGLQMHDFIRYLAGNDTTTAIAVHIEGLRDGRRFLQEVRAAVPRKPVLVVKSGRTRDGARVVSSHTASIAGDDRIHQAAFAQAGAIQVESFAEFNSLLLAFDHGKLPRGNRVCIISEGGGDCALTTDACVQRGLAVPPLSAASQARLRELIPPNGSVTNPLDLAGWENVVEATAIALADDAIDAVLVVGGFAGYFHINPRDREKEKRHVERMCDVVAGADKPVFVYSYFGYRPGPMLDRLREARIPLFLDHHDAAHALATLVRYRGLRERLAGRPFAAAAVPAPPAGSRRQLLEPEAKELLRRHGLACPPEALATSADEAVAHAERIGFPVVLKVVSRDIPHKTEAGGVRLDLPDAAAVRTAHAEVLAAARRAAPAADIAGVLVAAMDRRPGVEVILGGLHDPVFGPVIMFGLGGIFVEVLRDVVFRVCPLDAAEAEAMIREIAGFEILAGARGRPPVDLAALRDALVSLSDLLIGNPDIVEVDLNPVRARPDGLAVLDARMVRVLPS